MSSAYEWALDAVIGFCALLILLNWAGLVSWFYASVRHRSKLRFSSGSRLFGASAPAARYFCTHARLCLDSFGCHFFWIRVLASFLLSVRGRSRQTGLYEKGSLFASTGS